MPRPTDRGPGVVRGAEMLKRIADGRLRPDRLVGRTIGLDAAPAALVALGGPAAGAGMTVILPQA